MGGLVCLPEDGNPNYDYNGDYIYGLMIFQVVTCYYVLDGDVITRQGIIDKYNSLLDVTIADNTEYPALDLATDSSMNISTGGIEVTNSTDNLPYGDIVL